MYGRRKEKHARLAITVTSFASVQARNKAARLIVIPTGSEEEAVCCAIFTAKYFADRHAKAQLRKKLVVTNNNGTATAGSAASDEGLHSIRLQDEVAPAKFSTGLDCRSTYGGDACIDRPSRGESLLTDTVSRFFEGA